MQEKHKRLAKVAKDISKAKGTKISLQNMFLVFLCQLGVKDVMISIFWCFKAIKAKKAPRVAINTKGPIKY